MTKEEIKTELIKRYRYIYDYYPKTRKFETANIN